MPSVSNTGITAASADSGVLRNIGYASGRYVYPPVISETASSAATIVGQTWALPVFLPGGITFDRIGIETTVVGGAGSVVRLGAYGALASGYPGALALDAGTAAADATIGFKEITISWAPTRGTYFLMAANQVGTAATLRTCRPLPLLALPATSTGDLMIPRDNNATLTGAFPGTWVTSNITNDRRAPFVYLRCA